MHPRGGPPFAPPIDGILGPPPAAPLPLPLAVPLPFAPPPPPQQQMPPQQMPPFAPFEPHAGFPVDPYLPHDAPLPLPLPDTYPPLHKRHRPDFEPPLHPLEPIPQAYVDDIYSGPVRTYKQFLEFLGDDVTPEESKTLYEQYKREVQRRDCRHYFDETKTQEWFRELYDPAAFARLRDDKNARLLKKRINFLEAFSNHTLSVPNLDTDTSVSNEFWTTEGFDKPEFSKTENAGIETKDPVYNNTDEMAVVPRKPGSFWIFETNTVYVKKITTKVTRADLQSVFEKYGTITKIFISLPLREQGFVRMAWITFERKESAQEAIKKLQRFKLHDCELLLSVSQHPNRAPYQVPASFSLQPSLESDCQVSKRLVEAFDAERKFEGPNPITADSTKTIREVLDLNILYLRNVHLFCFYCGEEFNDEVEMAKRCGSIHIRGSHSKIDDPTLCEWRRQHEMRIMGRLNNPSGRFRFIFAAEDKAIEDFCDQNTIYVGAERFRCNICPKKVFKAPDFVRKHLVLKHQDLVEERRSLARSHQFMQAFLDDPERPCPAPNNAPSGPGANASANTSASAANSSASAHAIVPTSSIANPTRGPAASASSVPVQGASLGGAFQEGWLRPGSVESFNAVPPSTFFETRERISYEDLAPIIGDPRSYYRTTFFA